ncbi:MAG: ABC transporter permease [Chloroflexota bacterium]|nr:ABC transporter permease [Chloroflexota bacterium]
MSESSIRAPTSRGAAASEGLRGVVRKVGAIDEIGVIAALVVLCAFLAVASDKFLTIDNFINVSRQASYVGIMAVGMVFVISMGDIDLSVGSILMLSSISMAVALREGQHIVFAVVLGLLVATACGLANGVLAVLLRIPTIIVTLGTLSIFRGLGLVISDASPVSGHDIRTWFFTWIGGRVLGVWTSVWIMLAVCLLGWVLYSHTSFGRRVQAIGSNLQAARFSGVRVSRYRIMVMALMGFIVGIASVTVLAFNRNGSPTVGVGIELSVIAATIIGGTALTGGSGSVLGAVLGAIIIAFIQNGLALLAVSPAWSTAATGVVIIIAVTLDYLIKRR